VARVNDHIGEKAAAGRIEQLAAAAVQSQVDEVEQRYRWLVDNCPVAICVHEGGRLVYVNDTGVRKMGAESAEQLLGRPITDFVHPDSVPSMLARIAARQDDGAASPQAELVVLPLDGAARVVEVVSVLTRWEGKPAHQVIFRDLTDQKATENALRFQAALVPHGSDAIIATTPAGMVTSWNPAAEVIYRRPVTNALTLPVAEAVGAPLDPAAIIAGGGVVHTTHHAADGSPLAVRVSASRMDDGYVLMCADQTALRRAEQHFQTVVASLEEGIIVIAPDGAFESVNPAALRILGVSTIEVDLLEFAKATTIPIYDGDGELLDPGQRLVSQAPTRSPARGCIYGVDRFDDGRRVWLSVNWSLLNPADPTRSSVLVSFRDITEQHNTYHRLVHEATHDFVTGLPNRARILALVTGAIRSDEHRFGALLFIDLDKFKSINDALGHHAGDNVLQIAAQRLRQALRPDDVIGRVGGDEFVALLSAPIEPTEVDNLANRLHAALTEPIVIAADSDRTTDMTRISASIGIVELAPDEERDAAEILHDADLAMYHAKTTGQATSHFERDRLRRRASRFRS
jgi:diguanylate cyclase (GGDEF)-like protein/PAS domain S-box-containing protein